MFRLPARELFCRGKSVRARALKHEPAAARGLPALSPDAFAVQRDQTIGADPQEALPRAAGVR